MIQAEPERTQSEAITTFRMSAEVSWVGPRPGGNGYCVGTMDGKLISCSEEFHDLEFDALDGTGDEAINGVAWAGPWIGVATRASIDFRYCDPTDAGASVTASIATGAHGIISSAKGRFIAPLGQYGLFHARASAIEPKHLDTLVIERSKLNFYQAAGLGTAGDGDACVCALRDGGLAAIRFAEPDPTYSIRTAAFDGLDIVDCSAISSNTAPLAAVAAADDGTLVFFKNVFLDTDPQIVRFTAVDHVVYRVLVVKGSVVVVTSQATYIFVGLANQFLRDGAVPDANIPTLVVPAEAIEASVAWEKFVLIATVDDEIVRIDLGRVQHDMARGAIVTTRQTLDRYPRPSCHQWEGRVAS